MALIPRFEFRHCAPGWSGKYLDLGKGNSAPAPDYTPVAQASKESAEVMAALGRDQLAESQRQYDKNMAVAQPVIDAQLGLMNQTKDQGDQYFNYWKSNAQPVEGKLRDQAMQEMDPSFWETQAGQAMADARKGTTQQQNQLIRQGLRYGYSPSKLASLAASMANSQGLGVASMGNNARQQARNVGFARGMDVSGLYRGMPGASQGAYGLANNSGNSAVANSMQPGNQLLSGMAQGAGITGQGLGYQLQGLGGILNAQSSYANSLNANSGGGLGALLGTAGQLGAAWLMKPSDRRLKENIVPAGTDENTGLNLYEFTYKDDPEQRCFRGVMADEVESKFPDAVVYDDLGFASVNYGLLGIEMVEV